MAVKKPFLSKENTEKSSGMLNYSRAGLKNQWQQFSWGDES